MKAASFLSIVFSGMILVKMVGGAPAAQDPKVATQPGAPALPSSGPVSPVSSGPGPEGQSPGGTITQHKNPDGSTITVTRYNGPLPSSAFSPNPFGGFGGTPFWGQPFWGYPPQGPGPQQQQLPNTPAARGPSPPPPRPQTGGSPDLSSS